MAIWPPKLGTPYKVPSELFSGLKSSLFPQGFAHNTAEQWSFGWVRKKWRLARRLRVSRRKLHCFVLFLLWFVHDKTPNRWKNQVRCNFSRIWKKYVVNVYKICFHLVVFWYWSMTALLGPRFLKMKYCSFATCVCHLTGPCCGPDFDLCLLYSPTGKWKSTAISIRNTVDCVVKI